METLEQILDKIVGKKVYFYIQNSKLCPYEEIDLKLWKQQKDYFYITYPDEILEGSHCKSDTTLFLFDTKFKDFVVEYKNDTIYSVKFDIYRIVVYYSN